MPKAQSFFKENSKQLQNYPVFLFAQKFSIHIIIFAWPKSEGLKWLTTSPSRKIFVLGWKQNGVSFQSGNSPSDYRMSNALFKLFWDFSNIWNSQISNETCCKVTDTDHFDVISGALPWPWPTDSKICQSCIKNLCNSDNLNDKHTFEIVCTVTWDHSLPPWAADFELCH